MTQHIKMKYQKFRCDTIWISSPFGSIWVSETRTFNIQLKLNKFNVAVVCRLQTPHNSFPKKGQAKTSQPTCMWVLIIAFPVNVAKKNFQNGTPNCPHMIPARSNSGFGTWKRNMNWIVSLLCKIWISVSYVSWYNSSLDVCLSQPRIKYQYFKLPICLLLHSLYWKKWFFNIALSQKVF